MENTSSNLITIFEEVQATHEHLDDLADKVDLLGKIVTKPLDMAAKVKDFLI